MARRPKSTPSPLARAAEYGVKVAEPDWTAGAAAESESLSDLLKALMTPSADEGTLPFELLGMAQIAVKRASDGAYRTIPMNSGEELVFKGVRQGKRNQVIFEFQPMNPEYSQAEMGEDKVFDALGPEFEAAMMARLGFERITEFDTRKHDRQAMKFAQARREFLARSKRDKEAAVAAAEKEKEQSVQDAYASNPNFGIFG